MSTTTSYPHLFTPITLPHTGVTLPNRAIMGSMHLGLEELPGGFDRLAAFYRERAAGGVALIVTGGISPNEEGRLSVGGATMASSEDAAPHRLVTDAVHGEGGRIALQLLHAGRYGAQPDLVAPSPVRAPISPLTPRELSDADIERTITDFVRAAQLAQSVGYDGVEIMGSEGYLINEFIALETNQRADRWGGDLDGRLRLPVEIVRRVREAVGAEFIIIYRLSMLDLVPGGSTLEEVVELAQRVEAAGATVINTGIGWHEARIPTIAASVPRGAFAWVTRELRDKVSLPLIATNRINTPEAAEHILEAGDADMVSLARPFLADAEFISKSASGTPERINTCIACNQACLDHTFSGKLTSCLVNPRAGHETELIITATHTPKRLAVVGAGPAGLAFSVTAGERGHDVTLFDTADHIGGQLNVAMRVPGKSEFRETLRYFGVRLAETGVQLRLGDEATAATIASEGFDEVIIATGVTPRTPAIPGIDHPSVVGYLDVLRDGATVGKRVAVIGAGGIGFDTAEFLTEPEDSPGRNGDPATTGEFLAHWGVDPAYEHAGGLTTPAQLAPPRELFMLQRKDGKLGKGLGKTTGWIHRTELARRGVQMIGGVEYDRIDDAGLHISVDGQAQVLQVDSIVVCAGQESRRDLADELIGLGVTTHLIGGADVAGELDAKRAIDQGTRLAATI
ncbi:NADPH-dependent 2,4-dienoyl-CoA reductase [Leucobacter sp. G161]|uniref:NADPH-dependent 2,4-dienoyl-CoA reductase n=1 Tax=Leucobacter sp. G161 TaxID=663704 RepID=UPI00073CE860|nr:NADPH-dependent 2,4-dienoyl-CoA reductase [Leucobacter sp. G161]KUF05867.1 NADPH-dependent 2,4-dienoyl-CoA reductase [Leucobacter sp. G161]